IGGEGVIDIALIDCPAVGEPGEVAVEPDAEAEGVTCGLILLADVREVDVAELVAIVEVDEQVSVADGDVAGHCSSCCTHGLGGARRNVASSSQARWCNRTGSRIGNS